MTTKTKRGMLIAGGSTLSIALICLIASRFSVSEPETSRPTAVTTTPAVSVSISTTSKPIETEPEIAIPLNTTANSNEENIPEDTEPENVIEIDQSFTEATKPAEPPAPPVIEDETALTNPDVQPEYKPEQTTVTASTEAPASDTPRNGETSGNMIYADGFGWVVNEGGGGEGEYAEDMYENGNKIGTFG